MLYWRVLLPAFIALPFLEAVLHCTIQCNAKWYQINELLKIHCFKSPEPDRNPHVSIILLFENITQFKHAFLMPVKCSISYRKKKKKSYSVISLCHVFVNSVSSLLRRESLTPLLYSVRNLWPSWCSYQEVKMGWLRSKVISSAVGTLYWITLFRRGRRERKLACPLKSVDSVFIYLTSRTWYRDPLSSWCVTPSLVCKAPEGTETQCCSPWRLCGWSTHMPVLLRPHQVWPLAHASDISSPLH